MRNRFLVGLCLTSSLTAPAAAESWYEIATTDDSIDFADADSVWRSGSTAGVTIFRGLAPEGDSKASSFVKVRVEILCDSNQFRVMSAENYDSLRNYLSTAGGEPTWDYIAANSVASRSREFACDGAWRGTPVSDPFSAADDYWYYYYDY